MEEKLQFKNTAGERLCGILSIPSSGSKSPLAVLVHGFNSNKDNPAHAAITQLLAEEGIATFRFDFSGRGESEGHIEDSTLSKGVDELQAAMNVVVQSHHVEAGKIAIVGGSYGGNVSILYAARGAPVQALVLKSPVSDYPAVRELQIGKDGIEAWHKNGMAVLPDGTSSKFAFMDDARRIDTYSESAMIKCPVLIVHGSEDEVVPLQQSEKLARSLGGEAELQVIEDANHIYTYRPHFDEMCRATTRFLGKHLSI